MGDSGTAGTAGWRPQPVTLSAAFVSTAETDVLFADMLHPRQQQPVPKTTERRFNLKATARPAPDAWFKLKRHSDLLRPPHLH